MAKILAPISMKDPIVDLNTGNITPYFQRLLQDISDARIAESVVDALGGDPGADMVVVWDDTTNSFAFKTISEVIDWLGSEAQGDILYRGHDGWVLLPAGTDGDVLTTHGAAANPTWETPSAGGSAAWVLAGAGQTSVGVWDQAVDGTKATVDFTGLAGFTDIMLIVRNVTQSAAGVIVCRVSVDNGSSYYAASGDYVSLTTAGVESNNTVMAGFHLSTATAARSGIVILPAAGVANVPRPSQVLLSAAETRYFVASNSAINAVRVLSSASANLTGGKIYCLAR